jgi:hypothetical protein
MSFATDWMSGVGAIVAAAAAIAAALFTKRAAEASAKAAEAAADQVDLQRPRPIVIVAFLRSIAENAGNMAPMDRDFRLKNIGDSPAFDIEVGILKIPGSRLETAKLAYLLQGASEACVHQLDGSRAPIALTSSGIAGGFAADVAKYFNEQSKGEGSPGIDEVRHQVEFTVSYRALDGRCFKQAYAFVVFFAQLLACVEPVGSLLKTEQRRSGDLASQSVAAITTFHQRADHEDNLFLNRTYVLLTFNGFLALAVGLAPAQQARVGFVVMALVADLAWGFWARRSKRFIHALRKAGHEREDQKLWHRIFSGTERWFHSPLMIMSTIVPWGIFFSWIVIFVFLIVSLK